MEDEDRKNKKLLNRMGGEKYEDERKVMRNVDDKIFNEK